MSSRWTWRHKKQLVLRRRRRRIYRRKLMIAFAVVVSLSIFVSIEFVQSARFADWVKTVAMRFIPKDIGIQGDFQNFRIRLFPPGITVQNPSLYFEAGNVAQLPEGAKIQAERIDLIFYPLQMLSGKIQVHETVIDNGKVEITLDPALFRKKQTKKNYFFKVRWEDLLQIQSTAIHLKNIQVNLKWLKPEIQTEFTASHLILSPWDSQGESGYQLDLELTELLGKFPDSWKIPRAFDRFNAQVMMNSKGIRVESISTLTSGLSLNMKGKIEGDVLEGQQLPTRLEIKGSGDIRPFMKLAQVSSDIEAQLLFNGVFKTDLARPFEQVEFDGEVQGKDVVYHDWKLDEFHAQGRWSQIGGHNGRPTGTVALTRASLVRKETARSWNQPGDGGIVQVGSFEMKLGTEQRVEIPIDLKRAHVHWLAGSVFKKIYGLDFRATGPTKMAVVLGRTGLNWSIRSDVNLKLEDFRFDNLHYQSKKDPSTIVAVPELQLKGDLTVDPSGVYPGDLELLTGGHTKVQIDGKVDFKTGYDLTGQGVIDLKEAGKLAGNEILGHGPVTARVHGPTREVLIDFDVALDESFYLNLFLGKVEGHISVNEDKATIDFKRVRVNQGKTVAVCDGRLDLNADTQPIQLDFGIPKGEIQDLLVIFRNLTKPYWWFPETLVGPVKGNIQVRGGFSLDELLVQSQLAGEDWDFYGERFRHVDMRLAYDKGHYSIRDARLKKFFGTIYGQIEAQPNGTLHWNIGSEGLKLKDFDHIARLDIPFSGSLVIQSQGQGKGLEAKSSSTLQVQNLALRNRALPVSDVSLETDKGLFVLNAHLNGPQATIEFNHGLHGSKETKRNLLKAKFTHFDFSPFLQILNPELIEDPALTGQLTANLEANFLSDDWPNATGKVEIQEYALAKSGFQFNLTRPVSTHFTHGNIDPVELLLGDSKDRLRVGIFGKNGMLEGSLKGSVGLPILEFFTSVIADIEGSVLLDGSLKGSIAKPLVSTRGKIQGRILRLSSLQTPFENLEGSFLFRDGLLTLNELEAALPPGKVESTGTVELFMNRFPSLKLRTIFHRNTVRIYPFQTLTVMGNLDITGETLPYRVSGDIRVPTGVITEKFASAQGSGPRGAMKYSPPPRLLHEGGVPLFELDLNVRADRGIRVQNDLFNAETDMKVKLVNNLMNPGVVGKVNVINGDLGFKGHTFIIESGEVNFDRPLVFDPIINLSARAEVSQTRIKLFAQGRLSEMKVDLSSDPVLPQSEILSLLAVGFTSSDMQKFNSADRAALQQSEAASVLLQSFDFNREVRAKTGLEIQLEDAIDTQQGTSVFRAQSETDTTSAAPKLVIKRRIGKKVDVSVGSTVGVGTKSQQEVNAEVRLTPNVSVMGVWNAFEGVETEKSSQTSYGVDLKFQKRFK